MKIDVLFIYDTETELRFGGKTHSGIKIILS